MKKVAVFGAPGAGKSTLSKQLAAMRQLPLYALDKLFYKEGGGTVSSEVYSRTHAEIMEQDAWLMEGFGNYETLWPRLDAADTLVYVDLPFMLHAWWVTKRFLKGLFLTPEGWPKHSPMLRGTMASYRALWLCHKHLTPKYRIYVVEAATSKQVFHLRSAAEIASFLAQIGKLQRP